MKKGFTIIEVSLVIAIGGLIFLMAFIALPGLRASQRDTDRREGVISLIDNVKKYQQNNRGALPTQPDPGGATTVMWNSDISHATETSWAGFYRDYLGENFVDPNGQNYRLEVVKCSATAVDADCGGTSIISFRDEPFPNNYKMLVVLQATCYGDKAVGSANPRKVAVLYKLEGSGIYCGNS